MKEEIGNLTVDGLLADVVQRVETQEGSDAGLTEILSKHIILSNPASGNVDAALDAIYQLAEGRVSEKNQSTPSPSEP